VFFPVCRRAITMGLEDIMPQHTIFLSRLIGLFALIISIAELIHKAAIVETAAELAQAPPLLFIAGMFTLLGGLAMVLAHNVWTGGALPVVVTVIGWLMLIRGVVLVFISPGGAAGIFEALHFADLYYLYVAVPLLLGLYLTFAGFTASRR
jgi:hypothetical protein